MNTFAMMITIVGMCLCWIPGPVGIVGLSLAFAGTVIAVRGMTQISNSPAGLSMDVAAWTYGYVTIAYGLALLVREGGMRDAVFSLGISLSVAIALGGAGLVLFICAMLAGRKKFRFLFMGIAYVLHLFTCGAFTLALLHADALGVQLLR